MVLEIFEDQEYDESNCLSPKTLHRLTCLLVGHKRSQDRCTSCTKQRATGQACIEHKAQLENLCNIFSNSSEEKTLIDASQTITCGTRKQETQHASVTSETCLVARTAIHIWHPTIAPQMHRLTSFMISSRKQNVCIHTLLFRALCSTRLHRSTSTDGSAERKFCLRSLNRIHLSA